MNPIPVSTRFPVITYNLISLSNSLSCLVLATLPVMNGSIIPITPQPKKIIEANERHKVIISIFPLL